VSEEGKNMSDEQKMAAAEWNPTPEELAAGLAAQEKPNEENLSHYLCEVCGKEQDLTEKEAFSQGWDYPPFVGFWGILSPRTCGDCPIDKTAYWHVLTNGTSEIPENHLRTIKRVLAEQPRPTHG
jgi:hypothetical protein